MKALFVHDHIFFKEENSGDFYSPGGLPNHVWERYLKHFDSLTVIGRGKIVNKSLDNHLVLSSRNNVKFELLYSVSGGIEYFKKQSFIKNKLKNLILDSDVVILRLPSTLGNFAADICKKLEKRYVVEIVGCAWDITWNYGGLITKLFSPLRFVKTKKIISSSSAAIYVTQRFLQSRYPCNGIQSYASNVQIENFPKIILDQHLAQVFKEKKVLKLGFVGNISMKYKGLEVLLKALKNVVDTFQNVKLYLVGSGDPAWVTAMINKYQVKDYVIIVGPLRSGDEVFNFLDSLDLYIQPSLTEGLPRALIEAMSRATPALGSSVAGIPELLSKNCLHKPGDYQNLSTQIITFLKDKKKLAKMAHMNFEESKKYTVEVLEKRRELFFADVKTLFSTT
ncbi:glycosyltransferase [Salinimicrobium flavum]|uniref:Glycosyltransferase n=1 Tax=Salinimicrobium flavum TaxID=1737065 RepID=A0ABW5IUE7_9FLAO